VKAEDQPGLDSHWERRMNGGRITPDLTLDLHGDTLDTAYDRLVLEAVRIEVVATRFALLREVAVLQALTGALLPAAPVGAPVYGPVE
jgi:hypothetical protein